MDKGGSLNSRDEVTSYLKDRSPVLTLCLWSIGNNIRGRMSVVLTVSLESPSIPFKLWSLFCTTESHFKLEHDSNPFQLNIQNQQTRDDTLTYELWDREKRSHTWSDMRLLNVKSSFSKFLKRDKPFTWKTTWMQ